MQLRKSRLASKSSRRPLALPHGSRRRIDQIARIQADEKRYQASWRACLDRTPHWQVGQFDRDALATWSRKSVGAAILRGLWAEARAHVRRLQRSLVQSESVYQRANAAAKRPKRNLRRAR